MSHRWRVTRSAAILAVSVTLAGCATAADPDPWEPVNRAIFSFNEVTDQMFLEPAARGYRAALPQPVRDSIGNVLHNLREPAYAVNAALQGERDQFGTSVGRLIINSTLGIGGLFDVASAFGYQKVETRFDKTLQTWGVDQGPYVVLPFWGPDTLRGALGRIPDAYMNPIQYLDGEWPWITQNIMEGLDFRYRNIETIDDLRRGSIDMYATVRSIYLQRLKAGTLADGPDAQYDAIFEEDQNVE
ncbi:MlaA family lipoprotein [Geminicoccus roseus]|uniref:MlaA family lipoprotein n=1 Tax=Geminicoccus roseus TaxID=404900 RepID=UPI001969B784|nr:VacJ family lipoprotein [Geminicoccus roseus]